MAKHSILALIAALVFLFSAAGFASDLQVRRVPPEVTGAISSALESGFSIRNAYAARSEVHKNAYFIAAEMVGPGSNGAVGVWMKTGDLDGPGMYVSVDGYADEFSDFPYGRNTKLQVTISDPPARQLKQFVQDQVNITR